VTIKKRPMTADGTSVERRKTRRFPVVVPIEVSWRRRDCIGVKEDAVARQVNANGGFLKMSNYPALRSRVTLANFLSAQTAEARVLAAPDSRQGVANGIVVELIAPNESFWGVDLQVVEGNSDRHWDAKSATPQACYARDLWDCARITWPSSEEDQTIGK
jgi:hypothetical protein